MPQSIVWVLGAGFSRPLGGPLLRDLLTPSGRNNVVAAFPTLSTTITGPRKKVHTLYDSHRYKDETSPGQRLWRDAEEFVDYLDTAALGGPARARLLQFVQVEGLGPDPVKALADGARCMVAAECAAFLVGADPRTERWSPFVQWFQGLGPSDTIVTFNYDLVLECLAKHMPGKIEVVLPGGPRLVKSARVLKLHGSVDWKRRAGSPSTFLVVQDDSFPLVAEPEELAVATPGPTKSMRAAEFDALWTEAEDAIRKASAVVFVGYRFPPTDATARIRLLRALIQNEYPYLALHLVLGPRLGDDDNVRMVHLLRSAMRQARRVKAGPHDIEHVGPLSTFTLVQHPLWAEDFLGYVPGGHIWQANLHYD